MNNFNERLLYIFEEFSLNASSFADKIGVQRSSMSHIMSGRNKPSLDFILKIYETFPDISLPWLTIGEGDFYKKNYTPIANNNINNQANQNNVTEMESLESIDYNENIIQAEKIPVENIEYNPTAKEAAMDLTKTIFSNSTDYNSFNSDSKNTEEQPSTNKIEQNSETEQIVIFYTDGTFKTFRPR